MIPFNQPSITALEQEYVAKALAGKLCGDGAFTDMASSLFAEKVSAPGLMLTTSCTHALELAALLCDIQPGDEVILPSYTFTSTANAFLLRGARLVFCDIRHDTLNLDDQLLPQLINSKTKAIVPVHYAGVSCEMDEINYLAQESGLFVIEDAAQAVGSSYKNCPCGILSDIGCYSFHETKNYCMGEGGGICIRDQEMRKRAAIIREKGTNRSSFLRGEVDKYTWQQTGSSYLPSDILAAMLCAQLTRFDEIMQNRLRIWDAYHQAFETLEARGWRRPVIPANIKHNGHMYYLIAPSSVERSRFIFEMNQQGVQAVSHYEPLHASPMGLSLGYRPSDLPTTLEYAARLVRLPLWAGMSQVVSTRIIQTVSEVCNA